MVVTRQQPHFYLEKKYADFGLVAGVDEVGRGPWAGPVMSAAVWIDPELVESLPEGIRDSKKLGAIQRERIHTELLKLNISIAVGSADVREIDKLNILNASFLAMERALLLLQEKLPCKFNTILVDGNRRPEFKTLDKNTKIIPIVEGDNISLSIAVASIIAKQARDSYMTSLHLSHPEYGFNKHKGYGTKAHRLALEELGPTCHHRLSFAPIRSLRF